MNFGQAYKLMKQGHKVKMPDWGGYWCWENGTIMMYCKDGTVLNLLETENPEYTFNFMASDDFILANEENTPILGGKLKTGFSDALKALKKGQAIRLSHWEENVEVKIKYPYDAMFQKKKERITVPYLFITNKNGVMPYTPSQDELLSEDWEIIN